MAHAMAPANRPSDMADAYGAGQRRILVVGAGGGGAQVLDILTRRSDMRAVGILDNAPSATGKLLMGVPILGTTAEVERLWQEDAFDAAVVAIVADVAYRRAVFDAVDRLAVPFANAIDPSAVIGANVTIGRGNVIRPYCVLAACTTLGDNNYLAEFAGLGHHSRLGSHCTFAPRVVTSGWVHIGHSVQLGAGVSTTGHLSIGDRSKVAAGVTLSADVPPDSAVEPMAGYSVKPQLAA